jgi:hypothetical protein
MYTLPQPLQNGLCITVTVGTSASCFNSFQARPFQVEGSFEGDHCPPKREERPIYHLKREDSPDHQTISPDAYFNLTHLSIIFILL